MCYNRPQDVCVSVYLCVCVCVCVCVYMCVCIYMYVGKLVVALLL